MDFESRKSFICEVNLPECNGFLPSPEGFVITGLPCTLYVHTCDRGKPRFCFSDNPDQASEKSYGSALTSLPSQSEVPVPVDMQLIPASSHEYPDYIINTAKSKSKSSSSVNTTALNDETISPPSKTALTASSITNITNLPPAVEDNKTKPKKVCILLFVYSLLD